MKKIMNNNPPEQEKMENIELDKKIRNFFQGN
jgi:hypothetical protein